MGGITLVPAITSDHAHAVSMAFGNIARFYDKWYQTPLGTYVWSVETAAMKALFPSTSASVIIDIGAGTGMSLSLVEHYMNQLVGVDISWEMIAIAYQKTKNKARIHLVLADGMNLPFRPNIAELILGMTVLEFVSDPKSLLREIHRCLESTGNLQLGVLTSTNLWAIERRIRGLIQPDVFSYAKFPSVWQLIRLLRRNGFSIVQYIGSVYAPAITPHIFLPSFRQLDRKLGANRLSRVWGAFLVIHARCTEFNESEK